MLYFRPRLINFQIVLQFLLVIQFKCSISQQIIDKVQVCRYETDGGISFPITIDQISYQRKTIFFSLCSSTIEKCKFGDTSVCVVDEKQPSQSVINMGKFFIYKKDIAKKKEFLKSVGGQTCKENPRKNYTVIINLERDDLLSFGPVLAGIQQCEYHIRYMHPKNLPSCTTKIGDNLVDLQNLKDLNEVVISSGNIKYFLSLCSAAPSCGTSEETQYAACKIEGSVITPLAEVETSLVNYNKGILSIRGRAGISKGKKLIELILQCNWEESNVKGEFLKIFSGNKYTFRLESRHFCLFLPPDCIVNNEQYLFNISALSAKGRWNTKTQDKTIYLNVCGPLKNVSGKCKDQNSQVCLYQNRNAVANLGSIATRLEVTDENTLRLSYRDGSMCTSNETYTSEFEFKCSKNENGPILVNASNCSYKFIWETPTACPKYLTSGESNCFLSEQNGYRRDLSLVHTNEDRIIAIDGFTSFRYNLCGPLVQPCAGVENSVSACLQQRGNQFIAGWSKKKLTNSDGKLILKLKDETRKNNLETVVNFQCNYLAPPEGKVTLDNDKNLKSFVLNVQTPLACIPQTSVDCTTITNSGAAYDLSPLLSNRGNYVVRNGDNKYIINVCRSVINTDDDLCPVHAPVCWKRVNEPNLIYKYKRLGSVARPEWADDELVIRNNNGGYCRDSQASETTSTIHFRCSNEEGSPQFLKSDNCSVEFLWYTKYACQLPCSSCFYNISTNIVDVSFAKNEKITLLDNNNTIHFNLCCKNYTFCFERNCTIINSKPVLFLDKNGSQMIYKLKNNHSLINKVIFMLVCDSDKQNFSFVSKGLTDDSFRVEIRHHKNCKNEELTKPNKIILDNKESVNTENISLKNKINHPIPQSTVAPKEEITSPKLISKIEENSENTLKSTTNDTKNIAPKTKIEENLEYALKSSMKDTKMIAPKCSITLNKTKSVYSIDSIPPWKVLTRYANYSINLGSPSPTCNGFICKNTTAVVTSLCPNYSIGNDFLRLNFTGNNSCDGKNYYTSVTMICQNKSQVPYISSEKKCSVDFVYPSKDICDLFSAKHSSIGLIAGVAAASLILLCAVIGTLIAMYKKKHSYNALQGVNDMLLKEKEC